MKIKDFQLAGSWLCVSPPGPFSSSSLIPPSAVSLKKKRLISLGWLVFAGANQTESKEVEWNQKRKLLMKRVAPR
jgi:hypothetical protein